MTHSADMPFPPTPALAQLREHQKLIRAVQVPPALRALRELRDLVPPVLRDHWKLRRAPALPGLQALGGAVLALRETVQRVAELAAPSFLRLLPYLRQAVKMAEALEREEDTAWDALWALHDNRLTWLRSFTIHTLDLPGDHIGAVIEALLEGDWRDAADPTRHLAQDARRRHRNEQRARSQRLLLKRGQGWLDVETDLLILPGRGVDTDSGPGFARLHAQMDLQRVLHKKLPDDEIAIAVLLVEGYSEKEVMAELGLTERQLWAARKRLERRGVHLRSRRSPRS